MFLLLPFRRSGESWCSFPWTFWNYLSHINQLVFNSHTWKIIVIFFRHGVFFYLRNILNFFSNWVRVQINNLKCHFSLSGILHESHSQPWLHNVQVIYHPHSERLLSFHLKTVKYAWTRLNITGILKNQLHVCHWSSKCSFTNILHDITMKKINYTLSWEIGLVISIRTSGTFIERLEWLRLSFIMLAFGWAASFISLTRSGFSFF